MNWAKEFQNCFFLIFCVFFQYTIAFPIHEVLERIGYNGQDRPYSGLKPVNISVQLYIYSIGPINEQDFTFQVGFYLRQWWEDPRLKLNLTQPVTFGEIFTGLLWMPDTSPIDPKKLELYDSDVRTVLSTNGGIYTSQRMKATSKCPMKLHLYPMDTQYCPLSFGSYAYDDVDVRYHWNKLPIVKSTHLQLEGYSLMEIKHNAISKDYHLGNESASWSYLETTMIVKRTILYYIFRVYIPSMLLMIIICGTFWVPDRAVPARVTMIITSFLTNMLLLQSISETIVKIRYVTPMQLFLLVNTTMIVFAMVEYLTVLTLKRKLKLKFQNSQKTHNNSKDHFQKQDTRKTKTPEGDEENSKKSSTYALNMAYFSKMAPKSKERRRSAMATRSFRSVGAWSENESTLAENKVTPSQFGGVKSTANVGFDYSTHALDEICRAAFPVFYVLFCVIYFVYYLTVAKNR